MWKQVVFKRGESASVDRCGPISILSHFSKPFELVIHDNVSHFLKFKLNLCQQGFTRSESTVTNLVICLDFIAHLVISQGQADATYFDLRSASDLVPHTRFFINLVFLDFLVVK